MKDESQLWKNTTKKQIWSYCWWKKTQTTTWDVFFFKEPVAKNGMNYQPQLVNAGFWPSLVFLFGKQKSHFWPIDSGGWRGIGIAGDSGVRSQAMWKHGDGECARSVLFYMRFFWKCLGPKMAGQPTPSPKSKRMTSFREINGKYAVIGGFWVFWGKFVGKTFPCHGGILQSAIFQFWWVGLVVNFSDWSTYPLQADSEKNGFDMAILRETNGE